MIIELNGEDWSEITEGSDKFQLFPLENEEKNYDSQAYFPRYQSLFGHEPPRSRFRVGPIISSMLSP